LASGAELGKDARIVSVDKVGTSSTGTFKAVAATERSVQYVVLGGVLFAGTLLVAI
jgi:hypothetical protein